MKSIVLLSLLAFTVTGCSGNASQDSSTKLNEVSFTCDRGDSIRVQFFQHEEIAVLIRAGTATELKQTPSGSGFSYSNGPTSIRGKGDELTVSIGRMAPINCTAQ